MEWIWMEEFNSLVYYTPHKNKELGKQQQCFSSVAQICSCHVWKYKHPGTGLFRFWKRFYFTRFPGAPRLCTWDYYKRKDIYHIYLTLTLTLIIYLSIYLSRTKSWYLHVKKGHHKELLEMWTPKTRTVAGHCRGNIVHGKTDSLSKD